MSAVSKSALFIRPVASALASAANPSVCSFGSQFSAAAASAPASSASASAASAASSTNPPKFSLPNLPYQYHELEPAISGQIMETHHSKHHQAYVNNLNNALQQYADAQLKNDVAAQIRLQPAIRFNGGGHLNHSIFWTNLAPVKQGGGQPPEGALATQINKDFGGLDKLKAQLTAACVGVQGSGWGWLGWNATAGRIEIVTRANQDPLVELTPLLGIDVWEHAYYYLYGPNRAQYLNNIWSIINWKNVAERFQAAQQK